MRRDQRAVCGAGGDGGGAAAGTGANEGSAPAQAQAGTAQRTTGRAEDLSKVVYGRQDDAQAGQGNGENTGDDGATETKPAQQARPTFDELMQDPEYKAERQKRFDRQFNKRFAESKAQTEQMQKLAPALNLLAGKYGVQAGDVDALLEAITGDNELIERQAYDRGMEPDAYREYNRVLAENQQLKQAEAERQRAEQVNSQYQKWTEQAEQARQIYPGLDLRTEVRNPQFAQLLGAGIDVATAYQVVHMGELNAQLVQRAATEAKVSTAQAIQANKGRPRENGAQSPKAATVKADATKLNARDFDEIIRRAARGDKIRY